LHVIYWLGKIALEEVLENNKRTITFSPILRERLGHHIYGEIWATKIKTELQRLQLLNRPLHIISANMHSVMNSIFAADVLKSKLRGKSKTEIFEELSKTENSDLRALVAERATNEGMLFLPDTSGTNIDVQFFDTAKIKFENSAFNKYTVPEKTQDKPVHILMDYSFDVQAYESIEELL